MPACCPCPAALEGTGLWVVPRVEINVPAEGESGVPGCSAPRPPPSCRAVSLKIPRKNRRRCGGIHLRNASCGVGWHDCGAWQVWHPEGRLGRQAGADAASAAGFLLQEISGFALKAAKRLESGPPTLSRKVSRTGTCVSSPASDAWLLCGCGRLPPSPRSTLVGTALRFWFRPPGAPPGRPRAPAAPAWCLCVSASHGLLASVSGSVGLAPEPSPVGVGPDATTRLCAHAWV